MALNKKEFNDNKNIYLKSLSNNNNLLLTERANNILKMFFLEGKGTTEIAEKYNITRQRVHQLLSQYLNKLNKYNEQ